MPSTKAVTDVPAKPLHRVTQSKMRRIITDALERMLVEDAHLFRIGVSERTLTQRLAVYLHEALDGWRVDCEYNRNGEIPKDLRLFTGKPKSKVFPDIIVHKRGPLGPNLCVIEAKKSSDLTPKNRAFDYLKLRAYRKEFYYATTAFVVFVTKGDEPDYKVDFMLPPRS
jgi:hypothetical protein